MNNDQQLEIIWDAILSRDPALITSMFQKLDEGSQNIIKSHVIRMVQESGWQPEQVESAMIALKTITNLGDGTSGAPAKNDVK